MASPSFIGSLNSQPIVGNTFAAVVASLAPFLWYRMNETSGLVATDNSGNARNGTYLFNASTLTAAGLVTGDSDLGIRINRTDTVASGITMPSLRIDVTQPYTLMMLINATGAPTDAGVGALFQLGESGGAIEVDVVHVNTTSYYLRVMSSGQSERYHTVNYPYNTKKMVALTSDGLNNRLFVNGAQAGSDTAGGGSASTGLQRLFHASFGTPEYPHKGFGDEFVAWQSALTPAQILNLSNLAINGPA